ncbi:MAG: RNA polymerase sigma factor [Bacteroidaceae bacterium]|nr:RNA polymerase sigma factor [Bacteroidaceae bacterium]
MTQEEFIYDARGVRAKAVEIARQFGYALNDAEDIAQDVMLKLWCLHSSIHDEAHLKASAVITTKRVCIDKWRTTHLHTDINGALPIVDEDTLHDHLEYAELERWLNEQIARLPSTSGMVLRMRQLEHRELSEIAGILGIRQSSVSTLLSRARHELLTQLKRRKQQ